MPRAKRCWPRLRQLGRCCLVLLLLCDEQRLRHRVFLDSVERSSRSAAACRCGSFMHVCPDGCAHVQTTLCHVCGVCTVWLSLELWTTTVLRWSLFASLVNRVYLIEHSVELQHGPSVARHTCNTDTRSARALNLYTEYATPHAAVHGRRATLPAAHGICHTAAARRAQRRRAHGTSRPTS